MTLPSSSPTSSNISPNFDNSSYSTDIQSFKFIFVIPSFISLYLYTMFDTNTPQSPLCTPQNSTSSSPSPHELGPKRLANPRKAPVLHPRCSTTKITKLSLPQLPHCIPTLQTNNLITELPEVLLHPLPTMLLNPHTFF